MKPSWFKPDIGIDLGTATCLVYVKGRGIVVAEPSVVASDSQTGELICLGNEAQRMLGKAPAGINVSRPLRDGVISQYGLTLKMLQRYIKTACGFHIGRPRVVICIPSGITEVEERAVIDAARNAGAGATYLIEEPVAAAIGAGIDISDARGNMVVDIGGGTTDIAVISLESVVISKSIKIAGDKFNESIKDYVRRRHNLLIGDLTAEDVKIRIGNVLRKQENKTLRVKGRCLAQGIPREIVLRSSEMLEAMLAPLTGIVDAICEVIEMTPPELVSDIINGGICMTGGGALLRGFDDLISEATGIRAYVAPNPMNCVVLGTGKALEDVNRFTESRINISTAVSGQ